MDNYDVYWIKKEVAYHYFQRNSVLYQFIKEYKQKSDRPDLKRQFEYITRTFPINKLANHIIEIYQKCNIEIKGSTNSLEIIDNRYNIALHMNEKHLEFRCKTLFDAEQLLLPVLRSFHPFLFIMCEEMDNYGWITPIVWNEKRINEQVLYS